MNKKQVIYYYEGETEKKLLDFLKSTTETKIKPGKTEKFNLWENYFKAIQRKINKTDELFFVVDTDKTIEEAIFLENIKLLKAYKICLIIQNKNLEDELCFVCSKNNSRLLFKDFYNVNSKNEFKGKFNKDKNLTHTLSKNNFDFNKIWSRNTDFSNWLQKNNIAININCNYRK